MTPDQAVVSVFAALDAAAVCYMLVDSLASHFHGISRSTRDKDRDDIRSMLAVRGPDLDWAYIDRWALAHGTASLLTELKASRPST